MLESHKHLLNLTNLLRVMVIASLVMLTLGMLEASRMAEQLAVQASDAQTQDVDPIHLGDPDTWELYSPRHASQ